MTTGGEAPGVRSLALLLALTACAAPPPSRPAPSAGRVERLEVRVTSPTACAVDGDEPQLPDEGGRGYFAQIEALAVEATDASLAAIGVRFGGTGDLQHVVLDPHQAAALLRTPRRRGRAVRAGRPARSRASAASRRRRSGSRAPAAPSGWRSRGRGSRGGP